MAFEASGQPARVGWVTDVQNDFMCTEEEGGRLYVRDFADPTDPGAAQVRETIEKAVRWMQTECDAIVYTTDWHSADDEEIDADSPDPSRGTYPPHCMGLSSDLDLREGAAILPSIRPVEPLVLEREADPATAGIVASRAVRDCRPVVIRKNRFDVFAGNLAAEAFVLALVEELGGPVEFIVVGVARDVCVTQAIDGLQARGQSTVAVRDATWGLGLEPEEVTLERWRAGGRVVTLEELIQPPDGSATT